MNFYKFIFSTLKTFKDFSVVAALLFSPQTPFRRIM